MIDNKPEASQTVQDSKPRPPLVFPPNFRDVTAEKIGTIIGIIGAMAAKAPLDGLLRETPTLTGWRGRSTQDADPHPRRGG